MARSSDKYTQISKLTLIVDSSKGKRLLLSLITHYQEEEPAHQHGDPAMVSRCPRCGAAPGGQGPGPIHLSCRGHFLGTRGTSSGLLHKRHAQNTQPHTDMPRLAHSRLTGIAGPCLPQSLQGVRACGLWALVQSKGDGAMGPRSGHVRFSLQRPQEWKEVVGGAAGASTVSMMMRD